MITGLRFLALLCVVFVQASQAQQSLSVGDNGFEYDGNSASFQSGYRAPAIRVLLVPEKETVLSSSIAAEINGLTVSLGSSFNKGDVLLSFFVKNRWHVKQWCRLSWLVR